MALRLRQGGLVVLDGQHLQVVGRDAIGAHLRSFGPSPVTRVVPHDQLSEAYFDPARRLTLVRDTAADLPASVRENLGHSMDRFTERDQAEALRRLDYVKEIDARRYRGERPCTVPKFKIIADGVAAERRRIEAERRGVPVTSVPLEVVSGAAVRGWYAHWRKSGGAIQALVPLHDRKGRRGLVLDPEVEQIIALSIREDWLTLERSALSTVIGLIEGRVNKVNRTRVTTKLKVPNARTIRRWVDRNVSQLDRVMHREGHKAAENQFRQGRLAVRPLYPLAEVEIDHTPLDLQFVYQDGTPYVGDKRRKLTYRAWITVAICRTTRIVVGYCISPQAPSWTSVMACLRMAVLPKDVSDLPEGSRWPAYGLMDAIILDNAPEFHSHSLKAACGQLRIEVRYMPRGKGRMKGTVERFIGTVVRDFLQFWPGRTFRDPRERGDYPSHERAAATIEEVEAAFKLWVVEVYHNRPHSSLLRRTPLEQWDLMSAFGVSVPPNADDLDPLLAHVVHRTIQTTGIKHLGLHYQSAELAALRRRSGVHLGREYMVKIDTDDIGSLLVLDEETGKWLDVPCISPQLAQGTSLLQWRNVLELTQAHNDKNQAASRERMLDALLRLREQGKRLGARAKRPTNLDRDWFREKADAFDFDLRPEPGAARRAPDAPPGPGAETPQQPSPNVNASGFGPDPFTDVQVEVAAPRPGARRVIPSSAPDLADPSQWKVS